MAGIHENKPKLWSEKMPKLCGSFVVCWACWLINFAQLLDSTSTVVVTCDLR